MSLFAFFLKGLSSFSFPAFLFLGCFSMGFSGTTFSFPFSGDLLLFPLSSACFSGGTYSLLFFSVFPFSHSSSVWAFWLVFKKHVFFVEPSTVTCHPYPSYFDLSLKTPLHFTSYQSTPASLVFFSSGDFSGDCFDTVAFDALFLMSLSLFLFLCCDSFWSFYFRF